MSSPTAHSSRQSSRGDHSPTQTHRSSPTGATAPLSSSLGDFLGDDPNDVPTLTFDFRKKKGTKKVTETPGQHEVKFSVAIAMSIFNPAAVVNEGNERRKSTVDGAKAQTYLHVEYQLFPTTPSLPDKEVVKTDVVFYGYAAKVFPERVDAKHMKTWNNGDETWFSWVQNFVVMVNTEFLTELTTYKMLVRVWDSKEKCSTRARFDRPKGFRFPAPRPGQDPETVDGVKPCVLAMSRAYESDPVTQAMMDKIKPLPHMVFSRPVMKMGNSLTVARPFSSKSDRARSIVGLNGASPSMNSPTRTEGPEGSTKDKEAECELYTVYNPPPTGSTYVPSANYAQLDRLAQVAEASSSPRRGTVAHYTQRKVMQTSGQNTSRTAKTSNMGGYERSVGVSGEKTFLDDDVASSTDMKLESKRLQRLDAQEREAYAQNGRFFITVNMAALFVGKRVLERIQEPTGAVEDMFVQVTLSEDLLSRQQAEDLNPLIIRIKGASDMPENPESFEYLRNMCKPAYCQYRFFHQPLHVTMGRPQDKHIVWNDIQVVLTGLMDRVALFECLAGSQLTIEVHDRDRPPRRTDLTPALFGTDVDDERISSVTVIAGTKPLSAAPKKDPQSGQDDEDEKGATVSVWNPYGIAKVDFQELIFGQRAFHSSVPITPCPIPGALEVLGDSKTPSNPGNASSSGVDPSLDYRALPMGNYMDNQASLKVSLEMTFPLKPLNQSPDVATFGRLVAIYSSSDLSMSQLFQSLVRSINAKTLGITSDADHVITNKLKEMSMNLSQANDCNFNVITGFHLDDGEKCLTVLEGPKDLAIENVWVTLSLKRVWSRLRVLYDKNCGFSQRQYPNLGFQLPQLHLHEKLTSILTQPLLYVRDVIPAECFAGLTRLGQLVDCRNLKSAVKNGLFPSESMLLTLQKEFCQPKASSFEAPPQATASGETGGVLFAKTPRIHGMARFTNNLDNYNDAYIMEQEAKRTAASFKDFVRQNTEFVHSKSEENAQRRIKSCPAVQKVTADVQPAHNYSSQKLNSTELARGLIRKKLLQGRSYTYCHQFQRSSEFLPIEESELRQREEAEKRQRQVGLTDWVFPGVRDSMASNVPTVPLTLSQKEELQTPWMENRLHTGFLYPTLPDRGPLPKEYNQRDFRLFFHSQDFFGQEPISIMPAGDIKAEEEAVVKRMEFKEWQRQVIVANKEGHFHRVLPQTENTASGLKASNQLDRLKGIRKDPPKKGDRLLRLLNAEELPTLRVHTGQYGDCARGGLMPGEEPRKGLMRSFLQRSVTLPV